MTDKQDTNNDMRLIEQKLEAINTADPNLNLNEQSSSDYHQTMPKVKNTPSTNSTKERKKKGFVTDEVKQLPIDLPGPNVPERILFIVDTVREIEWTPFKSNQGEIYSPIDMTKRVIEIFVKLKLEIQPKHEFALMTLNAEGVTWICDFTNNSQRFLDSLDTIEEELLEEEQYTYDLEFCFKKILDKVEIDDNQCFPNYIVRGILIYGRSMTIPHLITNSQSFKSLTEHKNFFLDILYTHEPLSTDNKCKEVFEQLIEVDVNESSYLLECSRNLAELHLYMAKLIAHPLQRVKKPVLPPKYYNQQEVHTNV